MVEVCENMQLSGGWFFVCFRLIDCTVCLSGYGGYDDYNGYNDGYGFGSDRFGRGKVRIEFLN